MAQITSKFAQLAKDDDPQRIAIYEAVYADLARIGAAVPAQSASKITHDQLEKHLQQELGKLLKTELQKADKPNYTGKTDAEQTALVNDWRPEHGGAPPVGVLTVGFPFAPNILTEADITAAKL